MSAIPSLIFCTILPYSVLSLSTPNLTKIWQPGVLRDNIWTQGSWKGRLQEGQAGKGTFKYHIILLRVSPPCILV